MSTSSKHVTDLVNAPADWLNKGVTTSFGAVVYGERIRVGLLHKARGTGSRPHRHAVEQFNFVLRGTLMGEIAGEPFQCPKGHVVHIPADTLHTIIADPNDEDVIFYVVKDTSTREVRPADGEWSGPRLEAGFQVEDRAERNRDFRS